MDSRGRLSYVFTPRLTLSTFAECCVELQTCAHRLWLGVLFSL